MRFNFSYQGLVVVGLSEINHLETDIVLCRFTVRDMGANFKGVLVSLLEMLVELVPSPLTLSDLFHTGVFHTERLIARLL